ncbi:type IV secretion system protein [Xanthomonas translucens]|uniref:Type IV secretion system protein n=2 Tax=Xanthomonas translucens pv. translucens TaxID=134875 RepID=A0ABW9KU53_XANCT|nr:type IV secretion system protein [Xanthomonas translucens]QSQ29548.1 type IV secretion system protein [Xanthomonas translucens pv. translucens]QSQ34648.1 type IV secretion system protein [Xanthomonas translucens pv. translucens]QSQ44459.1 type IV secretion system protein [Xanthomonas translucens pv. translucens]UNT99601.1 type IV secretion system protein [Xanthomonas translucens pv. translucens]UNU12243.1 type IV secretion system protein [Xanthomonas translucens pv. translucens]
MQDVTSLLGNLGNYALFTLINNFLRDEIDYFQWSLLIRMSWWVTVTAMSALTVWVLFKGYQVATGQSRHSAMELVVTALRASLIVGVAMGMVSAAKPNGDESSLYWRATDGLSSAIVKTVTGSSDSPYKEIDKNLALMQVGMTIIDQINTAGDPERDKEKDRARMFSGLGMAGPAASHVGRAEPFGNLRLRRCRRCDFTIPPNGLPFGHSSMRNYGWPAATPAERAT